MQIAVDGCMHGELDIVYDMLCTLEEAEGIKIDLLLCYGDFQRSVVGLAGAVLLRYRAQGEEAEAHDQEQGVGRRVVCQETGMLRKQKLRHAWKGFSKSRSHSMLESNSLGGNQERPILERHCSMLSQLVTISIWTFKWRKSIAAGDHLNMDIKMEEVANGRPQNHCEY
ncbi:uncharacterized protein LOC120704320 isoform X2 [Panicum virgatum]|uniref:uncharacterized protein LOC120704320 isoform X2 n=1 Tax=Panicum virgatum TaxID=38727 RepID=UPI0019D5D7B1|nr:uncharacterized protein LOC120704320 isoform X2 [Panicum virgatum]